VANKADLLDEQQMNRVRELCEGIIFISATTGQGIPELEKLAMEKLG
jgi:50S ribosomal subunit-associated GTPase HflX